MGLARFEEQTHMRLKGVEHVLTRRIGLLWETENTKTRLRSTFDRDALLKMYADGDLVFVNTTVAPRLYAPDASSPELEVAKIRRLYSMAVVDVPNTRTRLQEAITEIWQRYRQPPVPPCVTSVFNWKRRFLGSGKDIRALVDDVHRRGNRSDRYPSEVVKICQEAIDAVYLRRERNSIQATLDRAEQEVDRENTQRPDGAKLKLPTRRLMRRLIGRLPAADSYAARYGRDAARKKFRSVTQHRLTDTPLERAEIDHTQLDVFVVDERTAMPLGRPYLTVCIDDYSRCILGVYIGFEPPSYSSVAKCLEHCFKPKVNLREEYPLVQHDWPAYGVMRELVVDMGTEFHSESLKLLCHSLGIEIHFSARKEPWFKGKIERFFGTFNRAVSHRTPGTTFSNIFERGEYDPSKHACITLSRLKELVMVWIADDYHQSIHRTIGTSPAAKWNSAICPDDIVLPDESVDVSAIVGTAHSRVLTHKGIEFEGLLYNSPELAELRRKHGEKLDVEIRVDEQDIGHVFVLWPGVPRPYKAPALMRDYATGMSLWAHRVCKRQLGESQSTGVDRQGLLDTKRRLRKLVEEELDQKKKRSRKRSGRFLQGSSPSGNTKEPPIELTPSALPASRDTLVVRDTVHEHANAEQAHSETDYDELLDFAPRWKD